MGWARPRFRWLYDGYLARKHPDILFSSWIRQILSAPYPILNPDSTIRILSQIQTDNKISSQIRSDLPPGITRLARLCCHHQRVQRQLLGTTYRKQARLFIVPGQEVLSSIWEDIRIFSIVSASCRLIYTVERTKHKSTISSDTGKSFLLPIQLFYFSSANTSGLLHWKIQKQHVYTVIVKNM